MFFYMGEEAKGRNKLGQSNGIVGMEALENNMSR